MKLFPFVFLHHRDGQSQVIEAPSKEIAIELMEILYGEQKIDGSICGFLYSSVMTFDAILRHIKESRKSKLTGIEFKKVDGTIRKSSFNPLWTYEANGEGTPLSSRRFLFLESFNHEKKQAKKISLYKDRVVKFKMGKEEVYL